MTTTEPGPGPRVRSRWAKHPVGPWERVETLQQGNPAQLTALGHAAQVWAGRHGLRGEYRVRDEGRTLWVRLTPRDATGEGLRRH